ncbi:zinc finger BED domain-containing protein 6-like [Rhineura floridana]|uniref:zinc finger BED domain-containing protein 6-like n=1 Tax=Rhineura floridana TaxID=261503 RepID=UPI002AC862DA|nr:zinc finger BED domain-containing protein 6-like [Rhineura floridana]XP_061445345.1 zinc finger BED domain-containing protein 6-like [Rhineura floridana]XP_061445346.1 zinc finger BED domain-containing protein 6-like [Rhineura floridana]XP_061445347.1 zinc finger BED domain-containing protein 6-like [Rhineura floridana]
MMPRRGRGRRGQLATFSRRGVAIHLQEPHFSGTAEAGISREPFPVMAAPAVSLQPVMKEEEEPGQSTVHDLFSYLKEKDDDEEEDTTELGAFSSTATTSSQLAVKEPGHPEAPEMLSYFKKEEEEEVEEVIERVSLSPPHILHPPAPPSAPPTYMSSTPMGRGGIEMVHFFTPMTHIPASHHHHKRGRDRDSLGMDGMPTHAPKKTTSAVWDYFTLDPREPCVAVCSTCHKRVRRGKDGGTRPGTTALHKHLKVHHGLHLPGVAVVPPSPLMPVKERSHGTTIVVTEPTAPTYHPARQERNQPYYPPTHSTAIQLASETAWMLAVDMQPLSYVESEGFRRLMAIAQPRWKVPSRVFFATKAVPELSKVVSRAVRQAVACSVGRTVHIAIDTWTSRQTASYMSVTGHWVVEFSGVLSRQHATLSVCAFEGPCSPQDICHKLREVLQDWLYDLKTGGVLLDDGANTVKAVRELRLKYVPCLARCLKLVVKAFLATDSHVDRLLKTSRRICGRYKRSLAIRRRLLEAHANLGLHRQSSGHEAHRRSNSTLRMLECLYRQRQAVGAIFEQDDEAASLHLTPADWKVVKCLVEILKPFEDAATLVTRPDATLCQALPLLWFLEEQLRALRTRYYQENNNTAAHLTTQALDCLEAENQLSEMKNTLICRVAAFLDPRFRDITTMKLGGADTSDAAMLREHILDLATRSYVPPGPDAEFSHMGRSSPQQPNSSSNPPGSAAWQFTMKRWRAITKSDPAMGLASEGGAAAALREMEEYLHDNVDHIGENADPMLYWQGKMGIWPALFKVALFHFGCPPTSVSSEDSPRGTSSLVDRGHPKNLSPANVKMFTFIRKNRHLIPQDWRLSLGDLPSSQSVMGSREDLDMEDEDDLLTMDEEQEEK